MQEVCAKCRVRPVPSDRSVCEVCYPIEPDNWRIQLRAFANDRELTRAEYDALTPKGKGYATYMQGEWNPNVPNYCPFEEKTDEWLQWHAGNFQAVIHVQDSEE